MKKKFRNHEKKFSLPSGKYFVSTKIIPKNEENEKRNYFTYIERNLLKEKILFFASMVAKFYMDFCL
jgi:hypothetical protein